MRPETPKLLEDIRDAAAFIREVTVPLTAERFAADRLVRQAVERNFEIIGEAMNRLHRVDPETATAIDRYPQIIAFRNILIHGYDQIDPAIVWDIIVRKLPELHAQTQALLGIRG